MMVMETDIKDIKLIDIQRLKDDIDMLMFCCPAPVENLVFSHYISHLMMEE